jgi:ABC-type transport system involved in multi-copper enzyme maturation permease subunit
MMESPATSAGSYPVHGARCAGALVADSLRALTHRVVWRILIFVPALIAGVFVRLVAVDKQDVLYDYDSATDFHVVILLVMSAGIIGESASKGSLALLMVRPIRAWDIIRSRFLALCLISLAMGVLTVVTIIVLEQIKPVGLDYGVLFAHALARNLKAVLWIQLSAALSCFLPRFDNFGAIVIYITLELLATELWQSTGMTVPNPSKFFNVLLPPDFEILAYSLQFGIPFPSATVLRGLFYFAALSVLGTYFLSRRNLSWQR